VCKEVGGVAMKSVLQEIQSTVIKYANIIEQVIKVDVEIVDAYLLRIAGTGANNERISESMAQQGHVYKEVLSTGQSLFIEKPGQHLLCRACLRRDSCDEQAELCTPIILQGEIIGVIGLICFDKQQKDRLLADLDTYQEFVVQIADFISAKAYEKMETQRAQQMVELLNQVISQVDKGILILDNENRIQHANTAALKQLNIHQNAFEKISIEPTGDSLMDSEEYKVTIDDRIFYVIGEMLPVKPSLGECATILMFNDIKKVKSGIYSLTNLSKQYGLADIIGEAPRMKELKNRITKISNSNSTVLITGESGTGKELIARAIHSESGRRNNPLVSINCGAIPDTLLESELFGYVKGAFTGADPRGKIGKFELANKGVIFLDEVGDMPLYLQVKLLRVLQERKISRIGSNQLIDLDVRVIAATNRNLLELIRENKFREDLYYRLNVIPLNVPPLRERREDIKEIIQKLVFKYCKLFNKNVVGVDEETIGLLVRYPWPGNVRELENTVEFMINMNDSARKLTTDSLPQNILAFYQEVPSQTVSDYLIMPLKDWEKQHILKTLQICGNDTAGKRLAAKQLGISLATLYRKLEEYSLIEKYSSNSN
jgi:transcriptional regulator with PAS, ATPase and Fis domain